MSIKIFSSARKNISEESGRIKEMELDGKKILVTHINIRQSIFFLLLKLVVLELIFAVGFLLFMTFLTASSLPSEMKLQIISYSKLYFVLLVLIKISITIYIVLLWINEYYEIRPEYIFHRSGIIWNKEQKYPTKQIRSISIHQGVLGKIFHYGTLTLYDWYLEKYATLYLIHNPIKYARVLEGMLPKASQEKDILREQIIEKEE